MRRRMILLMLLATLVFVINHLLHFSQEQDRIASLPKNTNLLKAFTPQEGLNEAARIARQWDPDCFLQCVRIAFYGDIEHDQALSLEGRPIPPSGWMYRYFSPKRGRFLELYLTPDGRCHAEGSSAANYLDSQPLPTDFVDSPRAFQIVEDSYGEEFRKDADLFRIYAQLTTWPSNVGGPTDPIQHRPNWQIHYLAIRKEGPPPPAPAARRDLYLMIDAVKGDVLTVMLNENADVKVVFNAFPNQ